MVVFLTSSFWDYQERSEYTPKPLRSDNQFKENIERYWTPGAHVLAFSSAPEDAQLSDHLTREFFDAFTLSDFSIGEIRCFDDRAIHAFKQEHPDFDGKSEKEALKEALLWADVLFLSGGHAPTENEFIQRTELKELLMDKTVFDGLFIGLSAGSVNAASTVYLPPELEGESIDPDFRKTATGLGLTSLQILPHSQYMKTITLDGKDYFHEILANDTMDRKLFLIPDGSYFIIRNGLTELFGEAEFMEYGRITPVSSKIINSVNQSFDTDSRNALKANILLFHSFVSSYYDWVLELDVKSQDFILYYMSNRFINRGLVPVHLDSFDELISLFSDIFVVPEEKQTVKELINMNAIHKELVTKDSYVKTIHINAEDGIHAVNLRANTIKGYPDRLLVYLVDISFVLDHDWMTDEYSRTGFLSRAQALLSQGRLDNGYSLVYTNIQGFKAINDLLGTMSGDIIIFQERDILVKTFEPVLIARLESDHFAFITRTSKIIPENFDVVCNREYIDDSKHMPIITQCGVYHITDVSKKVPYMLDQAKLAEKTISSGHGVSYAIANETLSNNYVNQRLFISEVDRALQNKEFLTYYQPIVDANIQNIVSAEALIRWRHPEKGMIPPNQFIPVFEKEGIISKIDSYMIHNILDFNLKRMQEGKQVIPCAVNLSRIDFYDTKLLDMITTTLRKHQNIQNILKLEVTESAYAFLESDALTFLHEMKKMGLSILLDDFGSGMSSLSTLERFAFDIIKLDLGFTAKIGKNAKSEAIIKNTIGLSHDIGAKVIAEGVENKQQLEFLQNAGCDMIQGYFFYKPMPEEDFIKLLN